jgi:hypothetical protein
MSGLGKQENPLYLRVKKFEVPVDTVLVKKNGTVAPDEVVPNKMTFELPDGLDPQRDDLIILNIIATNRWKRPICFTSPQVGMGLQEYLRRDGLTYRLSPVRGSGNGSPDTDWMMHVLMTKFRNGNADNKGVYYDETNRAHLTTVQGIRQAFADLAQDLNAKGRKEDAKKVLMKCDSLVPGQNISYGMESRNETHNYTSYLLMEAAYEAGATELAAKISGQLKKDMNEQVDYYTSLGDIPRTKLQDVIFQYNRLSYMEQTQQKDYQSNEYINNNLSSKQLGLVREISSVFQITDLVKRVEDEHNPKAPKDTLNNKIDSNLPKSNLKVDTARKKDSPPKAKP